MAVTPAAIMDLTFNTQIRDMRTALEALEHYKAGRFRQATEGLLQVLDVEPKNWDARLMLAACYYRTGQFAAASRAFQYLIDKPEVGEDIRKKAQEGLSCSNEKLEKTSYPNARGSLVRPAWLG